MEGMKSGFVSLLICATFEMKKSNVQELDGLKLLLLDMISTTRPVEPARTREVSSEDWVAVCDMARQHRLSPLLHHRRQTIGTAWKVPVQVSERWADAYRRSAVRSLRLRQTLKRIVSLLNAASIPYAALKGAWLVERAYPHPALRPMRDIDIIVPPELALRVFDMLESHGFKRRDGTTNLADHMIGSSKHLPQLNDILFDITVEIHTRLIEHEGDGSTQLALCDTQMLLARATRQNGVNFLAPTDTLLHLVVHAVYDHRFNNGPLTFNDIALTITSQEIDWPRFWEMAELGNWSRGCILLFAVVQRYHDIGPQPVSEFSMPLDAEQLENAALLSLQSDDQRGLLAFRAELVVARTNLQRAKLLAHRAFPTWRALAAFSGSPKISFCLALHYPKWLAVRARQMLFKRHSPDVSADILRIAALESLIRGS